MGIHHVVHRINLAMQSLSNLTFFSCFDVFMTNLHSYFSHSPKCHLEFQKLVAITKTNGNKILKNMKTQWMSMLYLLKIIIVEYKPLFTIMQADQNPYKWQR
jgi:hypothetical protein